ncbi:MAG TPA: ATP-binding protein [Geobacteraceae bacterium]
MRVRFRWKLMLSYAVLVLLMGGTLYAYLRHTLENYFVEDIRGNLLNEARLARLLATREDALGREAEAVADVIGREIKARVTIIAPDGTVLGDSEVPPAELHHLENHSNRPEVRQALASGEGSSIRYSETLRLFMLYVAVRLQPDRGEPGVLRLALPLTSLAQASSRLHTMLGAALLVALLLSLGLSYLLSRLVTRSLRLIAETATHVGKGDFQRRVPVSGRDELADLARVMNDMAERIGSQVERLATEKNRLDAILSGMGEGLMVADAEGTIVLVNPAFRALFSPGTEVEGKSLMDIARHPDLHEAFRQVVATGGEQSAEIPLRLPEEKTLATHWVPLRTDGRLTGVVAVFHDISDIRKLENVRRDFVANVSHELRTPVTVIKGYAEALAEGSVDPEKEARFIGVIARHADRLSRLIADLLTLSSLESGGVALALVPVEPARAVAGAAALVEEKAREKGILLDLRETATAPAVLADPGRLEQVLVNLLDNAVTYTAANGAISVSAADEGEMVRISVSDTGIGIPQKDLPRIFERFYRVDAARSRDQGGTGLGLAIVKHIVQLHGGSVSVVSTPEKGTTFSFTLRKAA